MESLVCFPEEPCGHVATRTPGFYSCDVIPDNLKGSLAFKGTLGGAYGLFPSVKVTIEICRFLFVPWRCYQIVIVCIRSRLSAEPTVSPEQKLSGATEHLEQQEPPKQQGPSPRRRKETEKPAWGSARGPVQIGGALFFPDICLLLLPWPQGGAARVIVPSSPKSGFFFFKAEKKSKQRKKRRKIGANKSGVFLLLFFFFLPSSQAFLLLVLGLVEFFRRPHRLSATETLLLMVWRTKDLKIKKKERK